MDIGERFEVKVLCSDVCCQELLAPHSACLPCIVAPLNKRSSQKREIAWSNIISISLFLSHTLTHTNREKCTQDSSILSPPYRTIGNIKRIYTDSMISSHAFKIILSIFLSLSPCLYISLPILATTIKHHHFSFTPSIIITALFSRFLAFYFFFLI